jgi:hypothetical protein
MQTCADDKDRDKNWEQSGQDWTVKVERDNKRNNRGDDKQVQDGESHSSFHRIFPPIVRCEPTFRHQRMAQLAIFPDPRVSSSLFQSSVSMPLRFPRTPRCWLPTAPFHVQLKMLLEVSHVIENILCVVRALQPLPPHRSVHGSHHEITTVFSLDHELSGTLLQLQFQFVAMDHDQFTGCAVSAGLPQDQWSPTIDVDK